MDKVQVEIFGQTYTLKGGADGAHIREIAEFIDSRMREIQKGTGTSDGYRLAILTALNIAEELHRIKSQYDTLQAEASRSLDNLIELVKAAPQEDRNIVSSRERK